MKTPNILIGIVLAVLSIATSARDLPDNSLYHVGSTWRDQNNQSLAIAELAGKIQVVAFVYTYCEHSCPVILARLKKLKSSLPKHHAKQLQFLLISLDPARDTPAVLQSYMQSRDLAASEWKMLSGDPYDVLEFSALLGVKYKPMDTQGKDFAHSNMITVLDKQGVMHYQMKGLNEDLNTVSQAIIELLSDASN